MVNRGGTFQHRPIFLLSGQRARHNNPRRRAGPQRRQIIRRTSSRNCRRRAVHQEPSRRPDRGVGGRVAETRARIDGGVSSRCEDLEPVSPLHHRNDSHRNGVVDQTIGDCRAHIRAARNRRDRRLVFEVIVPVRVLDQLLRRDIPLFERARRDNSVRKSLLNRRCLRLELNPLELNPVGRDTSRRDGVEADGD